MPSADHSSGNDEHVIEQRSEGGEEKQTVREQDGGDHSANVKENLCRQQNAGEMDGEVYLCERETAKHPAHKLRRKNLRENGACNHHRSHHGNDDRESL